MNEEQTTDTVQRLELTHAPMGSGTLSLRDPIYNSQNVARSAIVSDNWALITEQSLGLDVWSGVGLRPKQGYLWASYDNAGEIEVLIPAENVAGFLPTKDPT